FGTAGMRGILGAGTNRLNIYNVRQASVGVAKYVNDAEGADKGVLIGYDTRHMSREFAKETAKVLANAGIHVYLFDKVHSVPEVSFGIRSLGCAAGVMITASHNPKEYNGYKVYGPDGGQLPPEAVQTVIDAMAAIDIFDAEYMDFAAAKDKGLIEIVGEKLDEEFMETVMTQQQNPEAVAAVADTFKLVYTPLHGTGSRPIKEVLKRIGFKNVLVVKEQDTEDGDFPTVKSPNPENKEAFTIAIEMAKV
ncbi:MAG: phospho-sugar mutase, partial [Firmicutes bacterium]|nr:phospho-sugar mutase [Bacillota bacterium]